MKPYLLALEIHPVEQGKTYEQLPLHCTLIHWFWLSSIESTVRSIHQLLKNQDVPQLSIGEEAQFTGVTNSGPISVVVNKVKRTAVITELHEAVVKILEDAKVEYSMPQYIHSGYVPHVTHQKDGRLTKGDAVKVSSLYLAQADDPAYGNDRTIVHKFYFRNEGEK